uniref:clathrin coat assembly protein AP180 n=1 Tax=Erigeron canadensis TaxID=72917 RepID=UPI001CB9D0F4|nr:clathrin coat assembly protein AP180 [Erigeron canadensis]
MPNRLQQAIGAIKDQTSISLAIVNSSSNIQIAVLKATLHDELPIDERYVYEILDLISSDKNYASSCARAICKRITRTHNWIVALKSLMLVLRIFQDGDPYFPREILHASKSGGRRLNLLDFNNYSKANPWDYTGFIRTFGLYLEERLECFLTGKLQRRYTHNNKDGCNHFRKKSNDMKPAMLLDKIAYWQRLRQRAIATRPTGIAKDNQLVKISCYAVVKESFNLYRDISDGLALLLDNVLPLPYQSRVRILEICVDAKKQFEELHEFYTESISLGVGESLEYPTVQLLSKELIETLQELLKDQTTSQTQDKALVLQGVNLFSSHQSYGEESVFSGFSSSTERTSDKTSESGSEYESSEKILIATEEAKSPSISIGLKACSDRSDMNCSTGSSHVTNPADNLVSFDEWPAKDENKENQENEKNQDLLQSVLATDLSESSSSNSQSQPASSNNWEFVPAKSETPSSNTLTHSFCDLENPQAQNGFKNFSKRRETGSNYGWELAMAQTPTNQQSPNQTTILMNTFETSSDYKLHRHPQPQLTPINHDNPFLYDLYDIPVNNSCIISYWSQNQAIDTNNPFRKVQNDPFTPGASIEDCPAQVTISRDEYYRLINQQYLLQQQLLPIGAKQDDC